MKQESEALEPSKKVSIYVRTKNTTPSSYYRIIQYADKMDYTIKIREISSVTVYDFKMNNSTENKISKGLILIIYYLNMLIRSSFFLLIDLFKKPDVVIVSKTFCPKYTPLYLSKLIQLIAKNTCLYWDFDDLIFLSGEISNRQRLILEKYSKRIIVTSEFLKSQIIEKYQNKVIILPTTDGDFHEVDIYKLITDRLATLKNEIRLIWVGTSTTLKHVEYVIKIIDNAAKSLEEKYNKKIILTIVCNKPLMYEADSLIVKNVKWTRDIAKKEIYRSHIGIMPLIDNEYSRGKGAFKLIQYMATGLPIIASNVGLNKNVVDNSNGYLVFEEKSHNEWYAAIDKLIESNEKWTNYSIRSFERWNNEFSYDYNLNVWDGLIQTGGK